MSAAGHGARRAAPPPAPLAGGGRWPGHPHGMWTFDRCEKQTLCGDSHLAPIFHFDPTGKVIANFGADMFAAPHGLFADRYGNVWVTDFYIRNGKGYTVRKFSPDGKLLMTLGKDGVARRQ